MAEILYRTETFDEIQVSTLTHPSFRGARAAVVLPFEAEGLVSGDVPHELPHVMEHVVCSGDGTLPSRQYRTRMTEFGGYNNASTTSQINGQLKFESQQPDFAIHIIDAMFKAIRSPQYDESLFVSERQIVGNELLRDSHSPFGLREERRRVAWGIDYRTMQSGLESLDACTPEVAEDFFTGISTRKNIRLVLTGSSASVENMTQAALNAFSDLPEGKRIHSFGSRQKPHPVYYEPAPELPAGQSYFWLAQTAEVPTGFDNPALQSILRICLANFLNEGEHGIHDVSRELGLSYGLRANVGFYLNQWTSYLSDTAQTTKVEQSVDVLAQRMSRVENFSIADFEGQKKRILGSTALYPDSILDVAKGLEGSVGPGLEYEFYLPQTYLRTIETIDPTVIVRAVHEVGAALSRADFTQAFSYGEYKFS